jgi:hypothetical protein
MGTLACRLLKYKMIEMALQAATAAEQINAALGPDAFDGDALAFLMLVYRDPRQPAGLRLEAAKAALPYEKPRIASIAAKGENDDLYNMSREELEKIIYGKTLVEIEAERRANALPPQKPKLVSSRANP